MSARAQASGGEPRKASQRHTRHAEPVPVRITPKWRPRDRVRWNGRDGVFRRDVGGTEHAEIVIGERVYRVQTQDLTK